MRLCVRTLLLLSTLALPALVHAQNPDPRDYEVGFFVPSHTTIINSYLRHVSATEGRNVSVDALAFRATHIIKFGDLVLTPFDVILPVQDLRAYTPVGGVLAGLDPAASMIPKDFKLTTHAAGIADVVYLPTIGHGIIENAKDHTHTYYALTMYITAPTGQYNKKAVANIGANRWTFNPLVMVGQRFARAFTFEVMANLAFFTNNTDYRLPQTAATGSDLTLKQKPSFSAAAHLAIDLHPLFYVAGSYWLALNGRRELDGVPMVGEVTETAKNTVHSFRLNFGIRVTPQTLILAQWQEDFERSNNAGVLSHFFGLRLTHAFFAPQGTPTRAPVTDVAVPVQPPPPSEPAPLPSQKLVDPTIAPPPGLPPAEPLPAPPPVTPPVAPY